MNTWLDGRFWAPYFRRSYVSEIQWSATVLRDRLLPTLNDISKEADDVRDRAWRDFMSQPSDGYDDPGDYVEPAQEAGLDHYMRLSAVRQALVNMSAVALWHLVEQQVLEFLKRQVLSVHEEEEAKLHKVSVFIQRMLIAGMDVTLLPTWSKLNELRLVANSIKHGEGSSLNELIQIKPEILTHPDLRGQDRLFFRSPRPRANRPAGGEDLYVADAELDEYFAAATQFWTDLAVEVERLSMAKT